MTTLKHYEDDHGSILKATNKTASKHIKHLLSKYADRTVKQRYAALTAMADFFVNMGKMASNPFRACRYLINQRLERDVRSTKTIPYSAVLGFLEGIETNTRRGRMKQAAIALLFGSGLRRSELLSLKCSDVHVDAEGLIYLTLGHTKAGKPDARAVMPWTWEYLSQYVTQRKGEIDACSEPLFVNYFNEQSKTGAFKIKPLAVKTLYRYYKEVTDAAPHSARAAFATKLLQEGVDDNAVARALGHSTTEQVKIYDKRRVHQADFPVHKIRL